MKQIKNKRNQWIYISYVILSAFIICIFASLLVHAAEDTDTLLLRYEEYLSSFELIETKEQITTNGFTIIEEQVLPFSTQILLVPAFDNRYKRLAIFLVEEDGTVIYKTEQLETNNQNKGELKQLNKSIAAISFQDANGDELTDILLITMCESKNELGESKLYKVGDVLFQQPAPSKQAFYRDYRIGDKLNRYGMNRSISFMMSYLTEDYSTEFLYTSDTLEELMLHGFRISPNHSFINEFEKWGRLYIIPGSYSMAEYTVYMIYLVNERGHIVWSLQPMREYESLYVSKGVTCVDIDGDGLKDIVVLGRYITGRRENEPTSINDYSVYYQRNEGFYEDTYIKEEYQCNNDTLEQITERLRFYWGWK